MKQKKERNRGADQVDTCESEDALNSIYKAENLFPVETEGPNKGKYIPKKDENGNIVIDPTTQIKKSSFILDFNVFKECVDMSRPIEKLAKDCQLSKEEMEIINKLFAPPKPKVKEESHTHQFLKKNRIRRQIISEPREGKEAGNRDVKVVGAHKKKRTEQSQLPKFTPKDAGFLHRAYSATDQQKLSSKFSKKGTLKDADFKSMQQDTKTNPLYHPQRHLDMLKSEQELAVLEECGPNGIRKLISELNSYSNSLLPEDPIIKLQGQDSED